MLPDYAKGFITFVQNELDIKVWDGEIPRQDTDGTEIDPASFPAFSGDMTEDGVRRNYTFEDCWEEEGIFRFYLFHTSRESLLPTMEELEELLIREGNWGDINLGTGMGLIGCLLDSWSLTRVEGIRLRNNEYLYQGIMNFETKTNGATVTR